MEENFELGPEGFNKKGCILINQVRVKGTTGGGGGT